MEFYLVQTLNGISYGLLLFMLSSGLTLVFSLGLERPPVEHPLVREEPALPAA